MKRKGWILSFVGVGIGVISSIPAALTLAFNPEPDLNAATIGLFGSGCSLGFVTTYFGMTQAT